MASFEEETDFDTQTTVQTPEELIIESICNFYNKDPTIFDVFSIITIIICSISLLIILIVAAISIIKMKKMDKLNSSLKVLFYIGIISAIIVSCSSIIIITLCLANDIDLLIIAGIPLAGIFEFGYNTLWFCVLGTLIARLYITFEYSTYKISNCVRNTFIGLFVLLICIYIAEFTLIIYLMDEHIYSIYYSLLALSILSYLVYITTSIWAVYMFAKNILSLAHSRVNTSQSLFELNQSQKKLVDMTAKSVSLFVIAASSTFILVVLIMLSNFGIINIMQLPTILAPIDSCVSIICLYMQYSFAANHYNKYCGCIDVCCKRLLARNMIKSMPQIKRPKYDPCPTNEPDDGEQNKMELIPASQSMS